MRMQTSIWAYPWDLLDEGVEAALDKIAGMGMDAVSISASYHSGKFMSPRNPKHRIYFPEGGVIYFRPSEAKFRDIPITPCTSHLAANNVFASALRHSERIGLQLTAWFVGTHNSRLAAKHPEFAVRNAFGDSYIYALCPSHEAVREYLHVLLDDFLSQYAVQAVELESVGYLGFYHGYHHEAYSVNLGPFEQALLALCFCPGCQRMGIDAGIDVEKIQFGICSTIDERIADSSRQDESFETSLSELMEYVTARSDLSHFLQIRSETVTGVIRTLSQTARRRNARIFSTGPVFVRSDVLGWVEGMDVRAISWILDRFEVSLYFEESERRVHEARAAMKLQLPCEVQAAVHAGHPFCRSEEDLMATLTSVREAGFTSVGFYNYGTLPEYRLNWIRQAVQLLRSSSASKSGMI